MTYREIDPSLAGIYIIKNNINGKCYIGQSIKLRSRLKDHMRNAKSGKLDLPIYRAINKYGFSNFTIDILESFIPTPDLENNSLIAILDKLEIDYIEKYNAYTEGYNCTKGGDFGVLGLKMTEEQKKKISITSSKMVSDGIVGKRVHMYNIVEKYYIYAWTIRYAEDITGVSRNNISKLCNNRYHKLFCSNFIASFNKEELEEKKQKILNQLDNFGINKNGIMCPNNTTWFKGMPGLNRGKKMPEAQKEKLRDKSTKYIVFQYDLEGVLLNSYIGMHNAAKAVNTDYGSIRRACSGKAKTCKGYVWKKELKLPDCKRAT